MLLSTYIGLQFYGNASGAMVDTQPVVEVGASIKGNKRLEAAITAGIIEPFIKGTEGRTQTLIVTGLGELITALPKKLGNMACAVEIGASPSAFDIAQAVWGSVATQLNNTGTMGQKLNGAGNAGDPWTTDLATYTTNGTAGKLLKDAKNQAALAASLSA